MGRRPKSAEVRARFWVGAGVWCDAEEGRGGGRGIQDDRALLAERLRRQPSEGASPAPAAAPVACRA
jgi:hypothetical protein